MVLVSREFLETTLLRDGLVADLLPDSGFIGEFRMECKMSGDRIQKTSSSGERTMRRRRSLLATLRDHELDAGVWQRNFGDYLTKSASLQPFSVS